MPPLTRAYRHLALINTDGVDAAQAHNSADEDAQHDEFGEEPLSQRLSPLQPYVGPRVVRRGIPSSEDEAQQKRRGLNFERLLEQEHGDPERRAVFVDQPAYLEGGRSKEAMHQALTLYRGGMFGDSGRAASLAGDGQSKGPIVYRDMRLLVDSIDAPDTIKRATNHRKLLLTYLWGVKLTGVGNEIKRALCLDVIRLHDGASNSPAEEDDDAVARADITTLNKLTTSDAPVRWMYDHRGDSDITGALKRWMTRWCKQTEHTGGTTLEMPLDTLFSRHALKAVGFAKHVQTLPVLLAINRAYSTVADAAATLSKEYHEKTNSVKSLSDWDSSFGVGASETNQREHHPISKAWLLMSDWAHANSNLCVDASGDGGVGVTSINSIITYLENPAIWADEAVADDGDGVTVTYHNVPDHIQHVPSSPSSDRSLPVAALTGVAHARSAGGGGGGQSVTIVGRLPCIDAPEWQNQPFLMAKMILRDLLEKGKGGEPPRCHVRISRAYYANNGRVFAEFMISPTATTATTATPTTTATASSSPPAPRRPEVPLHMFLLATGSVYLMPQYFWCKSVEELHLTIALYGASRDLAKARRLEADAHTPADQIIDHLVKPWRETFEGEPKNAMERKLDAFFHKLVEANPGGGSFNTVGEYMTALGDWHTTVFNVHMLESTNRPPVIQLAKASILSRIKSDHKLHWWKWASDTEVLTDQMIWGKPHHAKSKKPARATGNDDGSQ